MRPTATTPQDCFDMIFSSCGIGSQIGDLSVIPIVGHANAASGQSLRRLIQSPRNRMPRVESSQTSDIS